MGARVVVLDYGFGNVRSAVRALERVGADVTLTADRTTAQEADGLVVPGVGAFAACMAGLKAVRGHEVVGRRLAGNRPVLGICVGMQVMFDAGVEHGERADGIGEWPGVVERLQAPVVPHMGWSPVDGARGLDPLRGDRRRALLLRALLRRPDLHQGLRRERGGDLLAAEGHLGRPRRPLRRRRGGRPARRHPVPPREVG